MYENIKKLINNSKYIEAKTLIVEELKNNDNPDLWYLLFLSENNNYLEFDSNNINNTYAYNQATRLNNEDYELEFKLYCNLHKYKYLGKTFRLIQINNINHANSLMDKIEIVDNIDDRTIIYIDNFLSLNENDSLKYIKLLKCLSKKCDNNRLNNLLTKIIAINNYVDEDEKSYNDLGEDYFYGNNVRRDYKKAVQYFELSASQGDVKGQNNLAMCYKDGIGISKDYKKAYFYYELAAKQGDANGQNNLGNCYKDGIGVRKNYRKAIFYYELAAERNNLDAYNNLGDCYRIGIGVKKDFLRMMNYYEKSAKQGYFKAQFNLGECYYYGYGVEVNYKKAVFYYELAAEQNDKEAQIKLAGCYENGIGVDKDIKKALYWYGQASKNGAKSILMKILSLKSKIL